MKTNLFRCGFVLLFAPSAIAAAASATTELDAAKTAAAAGAPGGKPAVLSPRFQEVRDRINSLFQHRNSALPSFDPRFDPFRSPGAVAVAVASGPAAPEGVTLPPVPAESDVTLLQASVAALKVSGIVEIGGKQHFIINSRPYKEGDVIQTHAQGVAVYLRVREISRGSMVLVLNQAQTTLKWPKDGDGPAR